MEKIIQEIRKQLLAAKLAEDKLKNPNTLTTAAVRTIAKQNYPLIKKFPKAKIFSLCDTLLASGDWQERLIAFQWVFRIQKHYQVEDFHRFEEWFGNYVTGWGSCDDLCTHAFGHFVFVYPEVIPSIKKDWIVSQNPWFRRGATVVLIYSIRKGKYFQDGFEIADKLLMDPEDLVQKGYGWMLKEISNLAPIPVFNFVLDRKDRMPRTALRYAIEKLSPDLRAQAMKK